jgi:hypothetical protein
MFLAFSAFSNLCFGGGFLGIAAHETLGNKQLEDEIGAAYFLRFLIFFPSSTPSFSGNWKSTYSSFSFFAWMSLLRDYSVLYLPGSISRKQSPR